MKKLLTLVAMLCVFGVVDKTWAQEVKINYTGAASPAGNGLVVEGDGTVRMDGTATVWDDLRVPFTQAKQGSNLKPDFDPVNIGLLFPEDIESEIIYMVVQMPHKYKIGSNIHPHIHWQQTNANKPTWKMEYKWFNNGDAVPTNFTPIDTGGAGVFSYSSGNMAQISSFPAIVGTGMGLSSVLLIKLYRANVTGDVAGDVLAFQFDIHYEIDTEGSRNEFDK